MSDKNLDDAGQWRSRTVAFRDSPEEDMAIARMSRDGANERSSD